MIEIRDGIKFVFYSGLPHMYFIREMSTVTMANSITGDSPHSSQVPMVYLYKQLHFPLTVQSVITCTTT